MQVRLQCLPGVARSKPTEAGSSTVVGIEGLFRTYLVGIMLWHQTEILDFYYD